MLLFGDEASFAQWGSLSYTWAPRGQQPLVLTCGRRKAYKVFGLIDYFTGRLFTHGQTERFTAAAAGAKHAPTHEDVWLMKRVGAPQVSPDGHWIVVSVAEPSAHSPSSAPLSPKV